MCKSAIRHVLQDAVAIVTQCRVPEDELDERVSFGCLARDQADEIACCCFKKFICLCDLLLVGDELRLGWVSGFVLVRVESLEDDSVRPRGKALTN